MRGAPFALIVATLATATIFSSDPIAYTVSGPTWSQPQTPYFINTANLDLPGFSTETAVRAGADTWQQQSAAFRFVYTGLSTQTTTTNDGINLVLFRNASSGSAIATTYWWSIGSRIVDADIVFWDGAFQFFAGSSGTPTRAALAISSHQITSLVFQCGTRAPFRRTACIEEMA